MKLDLAAIRARAEKATPGPWHTTSADFGEFYVRWGNQSIDGDRIICEIGSWRSSIEVMFGDDDNARYIAGMDPQTTLALVDRIEALQFALALMVG
jgi:hypothetical protein